MLWFGMMQKWPWNASNRKLFATKLHEPNKLLSFHNIPKWVCMKCLKAQVIYNKNVQDVQGLTKSRQQNEIDEINLEEFLEWRNTSKDDIIVESIETESGKSTEE